MSRRFKRWRRKLITREDWERIASESFFTANLDYPHQTTSDYIAKRLSALTGKSITREEYEDIVGRANEEIGLFEDKYDEKIEMLVLLINQHFDSLTAK